MAVCRALTSQAGWAQRGMRTEQLAQTQGIDYKISQGTKGRKGNDTY